MKQITQIVAEKFSCSQKRLEESLKKLSQALLEYGLEDNKGVFKHLNAIKSATSLSVQFADLINVSNEFTDLNILENFTNAKNFYEAQRKRKKLNLMPSASCLVNKDELSDEQQAQQREKAEKFFTSVKTSTLFKIIPYILYNNAIKYSPTHNAVKTLYWTTGPDNGYIEVSNNGPHIPQDELEKLTEKKYRGANSVNFNNEEGFGLGLYFTKKILESCGYTMEVNSNEIDPNSTALIIDGNKVPISQFSVKIGITKESSKACTLALEKEDLTSFLQTMFLHEYSNLLTTIHNNIFNIDNYVRSNATTLSNSNIAEIFTQLQESAYLFELDLIKYTYALDRSFIQFSSKNELNLKPELINAIDHYNTQLQEKRVSTDAMIITKAGRLLYIQQKKKSIYDADSPELWINATDKIKEFPRLLLEFLVNVVKEDSTIEITITPVTVRGIKNLNLTISFETDNEIKLYSENTYTLPDSITYHNFILSYIEYILQKNNSSIKISEELKTELEIII